MLPIAQMERDEKDTAPALADGADDFQSAGFSQPVSDRDTALDAPQVHQLQSEVAIKPASGLLRLRPVARECGEEVLHHYLTTSGLEPKVEFGHGEAESLHQPRRQRSHQEQAQSPEANAIEGGGGRCGAWCVVRGGGRMTGGC